MIGKERFALSHGRKGAAKQKFMFDESIIFFCHRHEIDTNKCNILPVSNVLKIRPIRQEEKMNLFYPVTVAVRRLFLAAAVVGLLLGIAHADQWQSVKGPDGKVSAQLPAGFEQFERSSLTPVGNVKTIVKRYEAKGRILGFGYTKLPKVVMMMGGEQRAYGMARSRMLNEFNAKETGYRLTKFKGKNAGELLFTCEHNGTPHKGKAIFILVDQMLYVFNAIEPVNAKTDVGKRLFASVQVK